MSITLNGPPFLLRKKSWHALEISLIRRFDGICIEQCSAWMLTKALRPTQLRDFANATSIFHTPPARLMNAARKLQQGIVIPVGRLGKDLCSIQALSLRSQYRCTKQTWTSSSDISLTAGRQEDAIFPPGLHLLVMIDVAASKPLVSAAWSRPVLGSYSKDELSSRERITTPQLNSPTILIQNFRFVAKDMLLNTIPAPSAVMDHPPWMIS